MTNKSPELRITFMIFISIIIFSIHIFIFGNSDAVRVYDMPASLGRLTGKKKNVISFVQFFRLICGVNGETSLISSS